MDEGACPAETGTQLVVVYRVAVVRPGPLVAVPGLGRGVLCELHVVVSLPAFVAVVVLAVRVLPDHRPPQDPPRLSVLTEPKGVTSRWRRSFGRPGRRSECRRRCTSHTYVGGCGPRVSGRPETVETVPTELVGEG